MPVIRTGGWRMNSVENAYNENPELEWLRLTQDAYHSLEFVVTMHYLRKHLPLSGMILDAGGGPGRYTIELCRLGYPVVLLDLASGNITTAQEKIAQEAERIQDHLLTGMVGDIRDLTRFEDDFFDATLCLGGPISHIPSQEERQRAVAELARVTRPGGKVFISANGLLAVYRTILHRHSDDMINGALDRLQQDGNLFYRDMEWHFFRADEVQMLAESCGLETVEMAGCQGLSSTMIEETNLLSRHATKWQRWIDLTLQTAAEPAVVDLAEQILYIGRVGGRG